MTTEVHNPDTGPSKGASLLLALILIVVLVPLAISLAPVAKHDAHPAQEAPPGPMDHVMDSHHFHFFDSLGLKHLHLPTVFGHQITKFVVLEIIAAFLVALIYIPIARRLQRGEPARGAWDNAFEGLLTFVRDQIAKPAMGAGSADRYVGFLWTMFLFILFNNLLGMVPFLGSATASIYVTLGLALVVFFALHGSAVLEMSRDGHGHHNHGDHGHGDHAHGHEHHPAGPPNVVRGIGRYVGSLWPHIDLPGPLGWFIKPVVFVIEVMGILVRNAVLAVRLFANMFAGHMVLATILFFIQMAANLSFGMWGVVTLSSVLGIVALSLLEIFVAFLQAYIFTFLTALFMGMAIHPQH